MIHAAMAALNLSTLAGLSELRGHDYPRGRHRAHATRSGPIVHVHDRPATGHHRLATAADERGEADQRLWR